jgi:hypothetical protein
MLLAPIGLARNPLCRFSSPGSKLPRLAPTLRSPHRRPRARSSNRAHPLTGFGSLSEFHPYVTAATVRDSKRVALLGPFPRFLPLQRLSATRSHLPRQDPSRRLRCALRVSHPLDALLPSQPLRACSIPIPLMGFCPSRPCSPRGAVTPSRAPAPHGVSSRPIRMRLPLVGLAHRPEPAARPGV